MKRVALLAGLLGSLMALPVYAQEPSLLALPTQPGGPSGQPVPRLETDSRADSPVMPEPPDWRTAWGVVGLHIFSGGPKIAPNGEEYHPSFTIEEDVNFWLWRAQGLYAFADVRFWGERPEDGVTNARDGGLGFSKRQIDLSGGAAWNYAGAWEARASAYSLNNLNRGTNLVTPYGFNDGALLENRYYLSQEYSNLGRAGFDVTRANFLSVGYFPTKDLVGNDGQTFEPGLLLRAYLTQDLWDWPCYAFADGTFISERSLRPKLLLLDTGVAARPFSACHQWEFRLGVETTADVEVRRSFSLPYVAVRYVF